MELDMVVADELTQAIKYILLLSTGYTYINQMQMCEA